LALTEAGWRTAVVPPASGISQVHAALSAGLDLPDYFGRNLDALWNCLERS
jgi:RNAse (barnase) inhibitor barstar